MRGIQTSLIRCSCCCSAPSSLALSFTGDIHNELLASPRNPPQNASFWHCYSITLFFLCPFIHRERNAAEEYNNQKHGEIIICVDYMLTTMFCYFLLLQCSTQDKSDALWVSVFKFLQPGFPVAFFFILALNSFDTPAWEQLKRFATKFVAFYLQRLSQAFCSIFQMSVQFPKLLVVSRCLSTFVSFRFVKCWSVVFVLSSQIRRLEDFYHIWALSHTQVFIQQHFFQKKKAFLDWK